MPMFGSKPKSLRPLDLPSVEVFSVRFSGRTLWGWQQRDETGAILTHSETLLPDYVTCLCDALRRS